MVGASVWMPAYFMRIHHMSSTAIGMRLALILGLAGLIGTLAGGHLADRVVAKTHDERWYVLLCAIAVLATVPFTFVIYLTNDSGLALLFFVIPSVLNHMILGPIFATVQNLAGVRRRAMAAACYLFAVNLISMGIGPTLIGFLSDVFHARFGDDALRYSLLFLISVASTCAGLCFLYAARTLRDDLALAQDRSATGTEWKSA
jgi:MFS family permease